MSKVGAANYINQLSVKISFIYLFDTHTHTERTQAVAARKREAGSPLSRQPDQGLIPGP